MRERDVEKCLRELIEAMGGLCEKFKSPGRNNVPDRIITLPGSRIIYVELKAPDENPNSGQQRDHRRRRAMGFRVEVIDTKEKAKTLVRELIREI